MKIRELIMEAAPTVGRKYQHVEDLVFTNGSGGGLHAVERLQSMTQEGHGIELKWDGSPVMYWGKDEQGRFSMIPKNAWEYLKRGKTEVSPGVPTAMYSPEDIKNFVLGTGKATPEQAPQREAYAQELMNLWPYFEKVSPQKGYVEGGLLFYPSKPAQLNPQTQEYDFTPNITSFHIPVASELGKKIKSAKVMVAVTGFYDTLGSSDEGRFPNAEQLSNREVIVQGTTYVEKPPALDTAGLQKVEQFITANAAAIDMFLAPKPGLSKPGDILYKFYNQNLRTPGVKDKFQEWVTANVSGGQAQKILSDQKGLNAVLQSVDMLSQEKLKLIQLISAGTHGGIRQTKPEGYVQAHPGTQFKNDLPGQFVKTIDQANWAPRKD